jgi:predicted nucleic acid-binding protein
MAYWDAMIVRAVTQTGCRVLYSEDLQHGRRFGSTEIINPFL